MSRPSPFLGAIALLLVLAGLSAPAAAQQAANQQTTAPANQTAAATPPATTTTTQNTTTQPPPPTPVQLQLAPAPQTAAGNAAAPPQLPQRPLDGTIVLVMIGLLGLVGLSVLFIIKRALEAPASTWSLAEALSEPETVTVTAADGTPVRENGTTGPVLTATRLVASTSRLIAFMGLFGILLLYVGFGGVALYYFGTGQSPPAGMDEVRAFLLSGLTLFAPYLVNKFADVFKRAP